MKEIRYLPFNQMCNAYGYLIDSYKWQWHLSFTIADATYSYQQLFHQFKRWIKKLEREEKLRAAYLVVTALKPSPHIHGVMLGDRNLQEINSTKWEQEWTKLQGEKRGLSSRNAQLIETFKPRKGFQLGNYIGSHIIFNGQDSLFISEPGLLKQHRNKWADESYLKFINEIITPSVKVELDEQEMALFTVLEKSTTDQKGTGKIHSRQIEKKVGIRGQRLNRIIARLKELEIIEKWKPYRTKIPPGQSIHYEINKFIVAPKKSSERAHSREIEGGMSIEACTQSRIKNLPST